MKYIIILLLLFTLSCSLNKVKNNHGTLSLENKFNEIYVDKSNANDILSIFGPPSTKSEFDDNIWFYIERKKSNQSILKLEESSPKRVIIPHTSIPGEKGKSYFS